MDSAIYTEMNMGLHGMCTLYLSSFN